MIGQPIWQNSLILEDKTKSFASEDIRSGKLDDQFQKIQSPNLGFSSSQFWILFSVINPSDQEINWYIEYNFPLIDEVEIFGSNLPKTLLTRLGDKFPYEDRNEDYRNIIFPLIEKPRSISKYYMRISSESTIPLVLDVWTEKELIQKMNKEQIVFGLFYGIMFVMALYNFSIYVFTREKSYLSYVFFITSITFFHLVNNGFAFQYFWPNWVWWGNYCLPFFICLSCVTGVIFANYFLSIKKLSEKVFFSIFVWAGFVSTLSIITFSLPYRVAMVSSIGIAFLSAFVMISCGLYAFKSQVRASRYYLISWSFFLLGVLLYSLKSLGFLPDNHVTRWTIQIGTAVEVILLSLGLADRINFLSKSLRDNLRELSFAKSKIEESEKRFREIFQGSDEVILLLNESFEVLNANRALSKHLGFKLKDILGKKITEFLYKGKGQKSDFNALFVNDKLTDLKMTGSLISFMSEFSQKYIQEPKEMLCRLQYIDFGESREVVATLSPQIEDTMIQLIESEKIELSMNNYLRNAELVSQKITSQLAKYLSSIEQTEVRSCIREIIINAVEHGNLNISFEEKTNALVDGNYLDFLQKRQEDPRYSQKRVKIEYSFNSEFVAYRVTDEGKGFDHKKYMEKSIDQMNENHEEHGRGILMTKSIFDRIEYNDKGNQVSLIKYLNRY
ncbi:7TM diverse intracellular signaling domain-containing protein [Leptospira sp. 96542]|nr:7TM diverse intracellular signaling domain-containing protein [Leptospira sp. 96542]